MCELLVTRDGAVGVVTISHPEKRNAMTFDMWQRFPDCLTQLDADPAVRAIVVRGQGAEAFVSGADISQFSDEGSSGVRSRDYEAVVAAAIAAPAACNKAVIAAIAGLCFGGGMALAAGCDIRIAADNASFRMPAARLGMGYPLQSLRVFVDIVGPANTTEIFMSARKFDATEALRIGFLSQVVPRVEFEPKLATYVNLVADNAPLSMAAVKAGVRQFVLDPADRDLRSAAAKVEACFRSSDLVEGQKAFMQKRVPRFTGT